MNWKFSLIVPVCNGEKYLPEFFAALSSQDSQPAEILVSDSESTDTSSALCKENGAIVYPVKRQDFDHGGTRTFLAAQAQYDVLVFLTQDAILATPSSLGKLVSAIAPGRGGVACAYGRQLPRADASAASAHLRLFNYPASSAIRSFEDRKRLGLKTVFISNSFAAYSRDALRECGYFMDGLIFGEDTCTVGRLLRKGYKICYCAEAEVVHSHNYSLLEEFRRYFDIGVLHTSEKWLLDTYGVAEGVGSDYARSALLDLIDKKQYHLVPDWFCRCGCKFIGYTTGRNHKRLPGVMRRNLGMHRLWWQKKR